MTMSMQILCGTVLLALCTLIHIAVVAWSVPLLTRVGRRLRDSGAVGLRIATIFSVGVLAIVIAHTAQIWLWAAVFLLLEMFAAFPTAFYFATVTYTTLGYGDIVPGPESRILATFAAVTGLLTFGISTAYLIGILIHAMPDTFGEAGSRR